MNTCRFTRSDYDKFPATETQGPIWRGWTEICSEIALRTSGEHALLVFDTYHGVYDAELTEAVGKIWPEAEWITTESLFHDEAYLRALTEPYVTDDELFGYLSPLGIADTVPPSPSFPCDSTIQRTSSGHLSEERETFPASLPFSDLTFLFKSCEKGGFVCLQRIFQISNSGRHPVVPTSRSGKNHIEILHIVTAGFGVVV